MTRRGALMRGLSMVCLLTAGWLALPQGALADAPIETGWWTRENGGNEVGPPITTPRPPDVPEGGLLVAADLTGETAVSALRFRADVETASTLRLTSAQGFGTPAVLACAQNEGWAPADHGQWGHRPAPDCDFAKAAASVDGDVLTWSLSKKFIRDFRPFIEVILVPAPGAAPFRVAFEKPGKSSLTAPVKLVGTTTTTQPPPPTTTTEPPPPPTTTTTEAPKQFGGPQFAGGSAPTTPPSPPTTIPLPPTTISPPTQGGGVASPENVAAASAPDTTAERIAASLLLAVIAAALWFGSESRLPVQYLARIPVLGSRLPESWSAAPAPEPDEPVAGVGRFARTRSPGEAPPSL